MSVIIFVLKFMSRLLDKTIVIIIKLYKKNIDFNVHIVYCSMRLNKNFSYTQNGHNSSSIYKSNAVMPLGRKMSRIAINTIM